jgi:hypothetical protein
LPWNKDARRFKTPPGVYLERLGDLPGGAVELERAAALSDRKREVFSPPRADETHLQRRTAC